MSPATPTVLLGFLFLVFFSPLEVCISLVHLVIVCISVVIDISPGILIPAYASSSPAFLMMYSAYKLNKHRVK